MPTPAFARLAPVSYAANAVDQLAIATVPLALTAGGASASTVSVVVAAQSAAWLLVSLPAGALADRIPRRRLMQAGAIAAIAGALVAAAGSLSATPSALLLAIGVFVAAAGVVTQILCVFALMPGVVASAQLGRANAQLELARSLATIAAPLIAAFCIARGLGPVPFLLAFLAACLGLGAVSRLSADVPAPSARQPMLAAIGDGARFVLHEPILRAIALCACAWNPAFICLVSMFAPFAAHTLGFSIEEIGWAWAAYGTGALLAAFVAPAAMAHIPTGVLFVGGPLGSLAGSLVIVAGGQRWGLPAVLAGFFLTGFTPMVWLVLQTSVRQLLTPTEYLGRVAATITTAIYGIRPLGALAAGAAAYWWSPVAAMWLSVALFALSALAIIVSPAVGLKSMPVPRRSA